MINRIVLINISSIEIHLSEIFTEHIFLIWSFKLNNFYVVYRLVIVINKFSFANIFFIFMNRKKIYYIFSMSEFKDSWYISK